MTICKATEEEKGYFFTYKYFIAFLFLMKHNSKKHKNKRHY